MKKYRRSKTGDYENPLRKKFGSKFFCGIIEAPGVYFMLSAQRSILYIGKAKNLRRRITSYSHLKPGNASEHTLEMIESVDSIQWHECKSEREAIKRENELLHAVRPPFNIAHTEAFHYLFIGVKEGQQRGNSCLRRDLIRLDFQLSSHDWIQGDGYRLYGCFKHRKYTKQGYAALLRLIYAATFHGKRFWFPARLAKASPSWLYTIDFPSVWQPQLDTFFRGMSAELLYLLVQRLLENDCIPGFVRASIQDDINEVKRFYEIGPKELHELRTRNGFKPDVITHRQMDLLIAAELGVRQILGTPAKI